MPDIYYPGCRYRAGVAVIHNSTVWLSRCTTQGSEPSSQAPEWHRVMSTPPAATVSHKTVAMYLLPALEAEMRTQLVRQRMHEMEELNNELETLL